MDIVAVELILIALGYVSLSVTAQRKLTNMKRVKEIRAELNKITDDLRKMGSNISREIMAAKQKEMAALTTEMMRHQLKATFIILPVFILLVYVALPYAYASQPNITFMSFQFTYKTFFVAVAFVFGITSSIILAIYDKVSAKKAAAAAAAQPQTANA